MKILVTGGCGFIGSNLIARLAVLGGHEVVAFDNEVLGKREHIAGLPATFVKGDIRDRDAVERAFADADAVVHLAADTRVIESIEDPVFNFDVNVRGTYNILEVMRTKGPKRLVNASTGGAIVGDVEPPVHEEIAAKPVSPYGASKLAVEGYCSAYAGSYDLKPLSLRFANVYGPRSFHKGSAVATFMRAALVGKSITVYGDGNQTRDFVYVDDLCDGIVAGLTGDATGVIQLGTGVPVSVNQLLDAIDRVIAPRKIARNYQPARAGEIRDNYTDISKAKRVLGYQPKVSLEEGLARTFAWFLDQRR